MGKRQEIVKVSQGHVGLVTLWSYHDLAHECDPRSCGACHSVILPWSCLWMWSKVMWGLSLGDPIMILPMNVIQGHVGLYLSVIFLPWSCPWMWSWRGRRGGLAWGPRCRAGWCRCHSSLAGWPIRTSKNQSGIRLKSKFVPSNTVKWDAYLIIMPQCEGRPQIHTSKMYVYCLIDVSLKRIQ